MSAPRLCRTQKGFGPKVEPFCSVCQLQAAGRQRQHCTFASQPKPKSGVSLGLKRLLNVCKYWNLMAFLHISDLFFFRLFPSAATVSKLARDIWWKFHTRCPSWHNLDSNWRHWPQNYLDTETKPWLNHSFIQVCLALHLNLVLGFFLVLLEFLHYMKTITPIMQQSCLKVVIYQHCLQNNLVVLYSKLVYVVCFLDHLNKIYMNGYKMCCFKNITIMFSFANSCQI